MKTVYRRLGSEKKRLIGEPASFGHGWDMLIGANRGWSPLAPQILAFIREAGGSTG